MRLESPAFLDGQWMPRIHTGDGQGLSPALAWSEAPGPARSFALIMDDPDAPPGVWVHSVAGPELVEGFLVRSSRSLAKRSSWSIGPCRPSHWP
ncbi:hypothetical protein KBY82_13290 [Cyanobium sp. AMD-g]|uniref:YbhB/YbcL family Raf kinase inhibitor-like protein n=1 Tax=Cyanobium sp. AMD-g TaxID=2823699 RepID=UPI0037BF6F5C|nr:hypothetical protein [Cyanobium sp. AMD-g]